MSEKTRFKEKLKSPFQWSNMLDESRDYNSDQDNEPVQTTRKPDRSRLKKFNTK